MSVITRRGDDGQTDFMFGRRCSKNSLRVQAYGDVDELTSALGMARALGLSAQAAELVDTVQTHLIGLMGELATMPEDMPEYHRRGYAGIEPKDVRWVEEQAEALEKQGHIHFTGWVKPGKDAPPAAAALDLARAICRRAERSALALHEQEPLCNKSILIFLNRLSDLLWLAARYESSPQS